MHVIVKSAGFELDPALLAIVTDGFAVLPVAA
jgi:hypothetical protein